MVIALGLTIIANRAIIADTLPANTFTTCIALSATVVAMETRITDARAHVVTDAIARARA